MVISLLAIYFSIALIIYFTLPYRESVPFRDLLITSMFWLPVFIVLIINNNRR